MGDIDTIIVGRGGGSLEDLSAFNTEAVAMAVYHCRTPIISAVGHETDFTICDFVADLRAPTPSAAAELAVPDISNERLQITNYGITMNKVFQSRLDNEAKRIEMLRESSPLANADAFFETLEKNVDVSRERINACYRHILLKKENEFKSAVSALNALSPLAVLSRGYSISKKNGSVINAAGALTINDELEIVFSDGSVRARVTEVNENE